MMTTSRKKTTTSMPARPTTTCSEPGDPPVVPASQLPDPRSAAPAREITRSDTPPDTAQLARAVEHVSMRLALLMAPAMAASVYFRRIELTALAGLVGLLDVAVRLSRLDPPRSWLPTVVTGVRLAVTVALGAFGAPLHGIAVVAIVLLVFTLDALDGHLARRMNSESVMGAHLDGETDALLTATVCLFLYMRGLGAWALTAGFLRYVYVLIAHFVPSRGQAPRSRLAARAFGIALIGLLLGFLSIPGVSMIAPALATLLLCWSFGRSFYWSFRSPPAS
jgi:phosphatidylglycerophosphate synthase